ncbi:MAG TPA: hypothetical protein ENL03_06155, partial [Phycisphaerae bacterium]|nr:hypothetical protein [Phycisphaerae bacterium]
VVPAIHGLDMVIRIFDHTVRLIDLDTLGMVPDQLEHVQDMISRPSGLILIGGGSGSGKTTTLYAILRKIANAGRKIMTIENPVEFDLDGVNQTQTNPRIDLSFAEMLRAILRQDPDVIMIGEIRDELTAATAIRAANTGHLVLATIHAQSASRAIESMLSLGVNPYFFTAALRCTIAQVLVKRICPHCSTALPETAHMPLDPAVAKSIPENLQRRLHQGKGCPKCHNSGYNGRLGLFEMFLPDDETRNLILQGASSDTIDAAAARQNMLSLTQTGQLAAFTGLTTIEQVVQSLPAA